MTHPLVFYERGLTRLENEVRKNPNNKMLKDALEQMQTKYNKYIWDRWH